MSNFRITPDGPAVIPCLGPRSRRRSKKGSVRSTYDGEISKRITDPYLIESLSRDTKIRIKPPQTGNKVSKSSQSRSPRFKLNKNNSESSISFSSNNSNSVKKNDKNIRQNPRFPKYNPSPYRRHVEKPELDEQAESYLNADSKSEEEEKENEICIEDCLSIKSQLKKYRAYLIQERDYHQALNVHKKLIQLDAKIWELDHYTDELYGMKHRMSRHQEIEQIVKIYLDDWEASFKEFQENVQLEADQIQEENLNELEEFDSQIPDDLIIEFRKPSKKLIDTRDAERRLALDNQIQMAMKLKKIGDQMERFEVQEAFKKQKRMISERRKRIIKAQEERIKVFYNHINSVKISLIQQRDKLIKGYLFRLNDLDKKLDKDQEELKIKIERYCNSRVNEDRLEYIQNEELGVSIPKSRPSAGYNASIKKRYTNSSIERDQIKSPQKTSMTPATQRRIKISKKS